jgi:hypothetical protein
VKVERFTSDFATLLTLANVHGNNRDDQKMNFGKGRGKKERRGRVRKWKGGEDRGMGVGEEGTGREGTGDPPFTYPSLGLP